MRETGVVRFSIDGDREEAKKYFGFARTLLGQLKLQMQMNKIQVLSRTVVIEDSVVITVMSVFGLDTVSINVPETVEAAAIEAEPIAPTALVGIGWAEQVDASDTLATTGVLASTFDRMAAVLMKGAIALAGWGLGVLNLLDCDADLFVGAISGTTPGVFSLKHHAGIYFTFAATTTNPGAPHVFPSQDGKTIVTSTPSIASSTLRVYDIHQHTLANVTQPDGTVRLVVGTAYAGSISAEQSSFSFAFPAPVFDRELMHAMWWQYDSNFNAGEAIDGQTTLTVNSMAVPAGAISTYVVAVPNTFEMYTGYDSDPAEFAQTLADVPAEAVRPAGGAAPSWIKRLVRRVFYWNGLDSGYFANDMVLGSKVVLWSRDVIMRGTTEVFTPSGDTFAHVIEPITWGLNTSTDIAVFIHKQVPLVQDQHVDFLPDNPGIRDPAHPVTFNGAIVYKQDQSGVMAYSLVIVEGTAVTYNAPTSSNVDVRVHTNGQAMIVSGDGPTYILEKVGGGWVKQAIALPLVVHAVFPVATRCRWAYRPAPCCSTPARAFLTSNTQYVSLPLKSDGTFGFQLYSFAALAPGSVLADVYSGKTQKQANGAWAYTETLVGSTRVVPQAGQLTVSAFRAFGALRPYLS